MNPRGAGRGKRRSFTPERGGGRGRGRPRGFAARVKPSVKPRTARSVTRAVTHLLVFLRECLTALGTVWIQQPMPVPPPCRPPHLDAPPEGHPERLCPHQPMSAAETGIWAGLHTDP
jgi:hypothetical protein